MLLSSLNSNLPSEGQLRKAVGIYLQQAYPAGAPDAVGGLVPPTEPFDPAGWLDAVGEYDRKAEPDALRAISIRLGNSYYPRMKLRLARPPNHDRFLFMVDAHDTMLQCHGRPTEGEAIEELKRRNSEISQAIVSSWTAAGLPTEQSYLRRKIAQGRARR